MKGEERWAVTKLANTDPSISLVPAPLSCRALIIKQSINSRRVLIGTDTKLTNVESATRMTGGRWTL
jgi:hypothetical protein